MTYVRYIDKTRQYYLSEGYEKPYVWAHFEDAPFAPMSKALADCRVTIVSTSEITVRSDDQAQGSHPHGGMLVGKVYSIPSDTPVEMLYSPAEHYDVHATHLDDVNTFFPITRLHELAAAGLIGSVAARCHGVFINYSQRRTSEHDAPEVLRRCREDGVDVALLVPV